MNKLDDLTYLKSEAIHLLDKHGRNVANQILTDSRFCKWTGSSKPNLHHYGNGGLLKHTREVVELSLDMCEKYKDT